VHSESDTISEEIHENMALQIMLLQIMLLQIREARMKMKKQGRWLLPVGMVLLFALSLSAGDLDTKGKEWLGTHTDAAAINVNGSWHSKDWGTVTLRQTQDSREVTGDGDGWDITGVVSGKQAFLLFSHKGKVTYTAELTSQADGSLNGSYAKGYMGEKTKAKPMQLTKP
jgi:hypothetical protein